MTNPNTKMLDYVGNCNYGDMIDHKYVNSLISEGFINFVIMAIHVKNFELFSILINHCNPQFYPEIFRYQRKSDDIRITVDLLKRIPNYNLLFSVKEINLLIIASGGELLSYFPEWIYAVDSDQYLLRRRQVNKLVKDVYADVFVIILDYLPYDTDESKLCIDSINDQWV